jgi:hypothetical protein
VEDDVKERKRDYTHLASTAMGVYEARLRAQDFAPQGAVRSVGMDDTAAGAGPRRAGATRLDIYRKAIALLGAENEGHRRHADLRHAVTERVSIPSRWNRGRTPAREMYDSTMINASICTYIIHEFWNATMEECAKAERRVHRRRRMTFAGSRAIFYDVIHNTPQGAERPGEVPPRKAPRSPAWKRPRSGQLNHS